MTTVHHRMPLGMFQALARGNGGAAAIKELAAAQYSKHLILLRGVRKAAGPGDRFALRGYELLAEAQRHDPDATEIVVRHPSVGAWALRTLRGDQSVPGTSPDGLAAVAAAAAIRAGLSAEIEVPVTGNAVIFPSLGAAAANGHTAVIHTSPAEVRSQRLRVTVGDDAPGWQGLREVRAGSLDLVIDDLDPFRMPTAADLASRLTAAEIAEWSNQLLQVCSLLDSDAIGEIAAAVRVIVPCATPPGVLVSSSAPENFGAVAMSWQPDPYTCAVTLVHEVQHLKLSALLDLVSLTMPDDGRRYYAPWRVDPRPVSSLLQGAYAFLGVAGFWRRQRHITAAAEVRHRADTEFARWRTGAARVVRTLRSSGGLTPAGQDFVREMAVLLDAWEREPVPDEALAQARRQADAHLARWQADNGMTPA
jgi:HEXXH motif-containing protein